MIKHSDTATPRQRAILMKLLLVLLIVSLLCLNLFVMRLGTGFIILTLLVVALFSGGSIQFIRDWSFPVILLYVYEFLRGGAYNHVAKPLGIDPIARPLVWMEEKLFFFMDEIPTVKLQHWLKPDAMRGDVSANWYDYILFFFYTTFFWYWLGVGFVLWLKRRELFKPYMYGLVAFSMFDTILYAFLPTAPPWAAARVPFLLIPPVDRILWKIDLLPGDTLSFVTNYGHNDYAAFPSHHAAWPFFATLFLVKAFGKKAVPFFAIPLIVVFATWYGAEHYVIDSLAGFLVAYITYRIASSKRVIEVTSKHWSSATTRMKALLVRGSQVFPNSV